MGISLTEYKEFLIKSEILLFVTTERENKCVRLYKVEIEIAY
jgi:hypothetical protein